MILIISAHPYPQHSRANRVLLDAVRALPEVEVRALYDLYPDFDIDIEAEQEALSRASLVVWMHPMYWYSVPGMLKHWFDVVLSRGWAYPDRDGSGGKALHGKSCLWVTTTGGTEEAFTPEGRHAHPFDSFVTPIEQTARFCGMQWLRPIRLHGAHLVDDAALALVRDELVSRLRDWTQQVKAAHAN
jgi:glutathione-regulated potassium-efflux system ancillary protein KefF